MTIIQILSIIGMFSVIGHFIGAIIVETIKGHEMDKKLKK